MPTKPLILLAVEDTANLYESVKAYVRINVQLHGN